MMDSAGRGEVLDKAAMHVDAIRAMPKAWRQDVPPRFGGGSLDAELTDFERVGPLWLRADVRVRDQGKLLFDDKVNVINPALLAPNAIRPDEMVLNPEGAFKSTLLDAVFNATARLERPRLQRIGRSDRFRGDTTAVRAGTGDGHLQSGITNNWTTAQGGNTPTPNTAATATTVQALVSSGFYFIIVAYHAFDTSSIDDGHDVTAAVITVYASGGLAGNTNTTAIEAKAFGWTGGGLTTGDWINFTTASNWTGLPDLGSLALASWDNTSGNPNNLSGASALASINKAGNTEIAVALARSAGAAPTGINAASYRMADFTGSATDPLLTVTHEEPSSVVPQAMHHYRQLRS